MGIKESISEHTVLWIIGGALSAMGFLFWLGAMAYMDLRHITRADWVEAQIATQDEEIERLTLYNEFGTEGNKPARDQVILRAKNRKDKLERELNRIQKD